MGKDDLQQQFVSLEDVFSQLGMQLAEACQQLEASGTPPPASFLESLGQARLEFEALRSKVLSAAKFLELQPLPELDDIASLQALESLLHTVMHAGAAMEAAKDIRQRALTVVERALTLAHCEHDPYAPLLDLQNEARELHAVIAMAQWADLPPEAHALADGQHSLTALLNLVELRDGLDDEEWMSLQDGVTQSYGQPIAVPAARGKLFLAPDQTASQEDADSSLPVSDDHSQPSDMTVPDVAVPPSSVERDLEDGPASDAGDTPYIPDDEGQYDQQNIASADVDRFLREQIRAVRKETQEQTFIRSIRQRLR